MILTCENNWYILIYYLILIVLRRYIALCDETVSEVMTTKVVSRFPEFVFDAFIAIRDIENKWKVNSCI